MLDIISTAGALLGGLGLFILAIGMMTDGLRLAAGASLRSLLSNWTSTPLKGIFSGVLMTAIVQSSSAVTVASIGFVNAGLLSMRQALGIVYGANVGTTMTGWLVALAGFKFDIHNLALPMIGIGMLIKLIKGQGRTASFGLALVGFGLFFIGVDVLKSAFDGLVAVFDLTKISADGIGGIIIFTLMGVVMTILTQSSSASIALTITAASTGMVGLYAAAAMVIGANIGTTSTALIASIGATSNAKRVAFAQVIFNSATALVAFLLLPVLFFGIEWFSKVLDIEANISVSLALFHSVFNILGVILIFPFNNKLASFLESRFLTWEEKESNSRYLDKTIAMTPDLAVNALMLEMKSIAKRVSLLSREAIEVDFNQVKAFTQQSSVIKHLLENASNFIVSVESAQLSEETTQDLATMMRIEQYFLDCTQTSERLFHDFKMTKVKVDTHFTESHYQFVTNVLRFIEFGQDIQTRKLDAILSERTLLQQEHDAYKAKLLLAGTRGDISVHSMTDNLERLALINSVVQQWAKAMRSFSNINIGEQNKLDGNVISNQGV
ncbi:MAG: phosphate:Na+ symporter [Bermanella sp.]